MSKHQQKLEQVIDLLINEQEEKATELLHQIMVEKARSAWEELVESEDVAVEETMEEAVGGDSKEEFGNEIAADMGEVEHEEMFDGQESDEAGEEAGEESGEEVVGGDEAGEPAEEASVEERLDDLEAEFQQLAAEFDALMADEMKEPEHADLAGEMAMEPGMDDGMDAGGFGDVSIDEPMAGPGARMVGEATQLTKNVSDEGTDKEGKLVGTGKNSKTGKTETKSVLSGAPSKKDYGVDVVNFSKDVKDGHDKPKVGDADLGKNHNIGIKPKDAPKAKESPNDDKKAVSPLTKVKK